MSATDIPATRSSTRWTNPVHAWLKPRRLSLVRGASDPVVDQFIENLRGALEQLGFPVADRPDSEVSAILTTARFLEPLNWRRAMLFTARREFQLAETPTIFTVLHATHDQFQNTLDYLRQGLLKGRSEDAGFDFPGLAPSAHHTLFEQGTRGGPLMALVRLLQSQTKSIRIVLIVGDGRPDQGYLFDLVGAHPKIDGADQDYFYQDIALRIATALSTGEITEHTIDRPAIPRETWDLLAAPREMLAAAAALGKRKFFTEMVMIANLVHVPSVSASVANQYSEGCFATWEPQIDSLIATVTGSARPVEKDAITEDDLAVITGVRPDGRGATVRHVERKRNDSPSSESVEMMAMDAPLPRIHLPPAWGISGAVPVVRSKLHGHRGVASYDPTKVEFVALDDAYYHYPVSCATEAQANAIVAAFSRSLALQNPSDARQAVFTVLPGHGLMLVEKWVEGKKAFEHLYGLMDAGAIKIVNHIPQGLFTFKKIAGGRMGIFDAGLEAEEDAAREFQGK